MLRGFRLCSSKDYAAEEAVRWESRSAGRHLLGAQWTIHRGLITVTS